MKSETARERLIIIIAHQALGDSVTEDFIEWPVDLLADDIDTPHLRQLATYDKNVPFIEIEPDLKKAISELNWVLPPRGDAIIFYACAICRKILTEEMATDVALAELYRLWRNTAYSQEFEGEKRLDVWLILADSLDLAEDGYPPLSADFEGLSRSTFNEILKREARKFLQTHAVA